MYTLTVSSKYHLRAVIPVTPVITAIGCDDWGDGNPEKRKQYRSFFWISAFGKNDGVRGE